MIALTLFRFDEKYSIVIEPFNWGIGETERVLFDFCPTDRRHRQESEG
jgi:hypothetical protein